MALEGFVLSTGTLLEPVGLDERLNFHCGSTAGHSGVPLFYVPMFIFPSTPWREELPG